MFTVERSVASAAIRAARSALSQLRAVTNCASVSESLATSANRVDDGRSSRSNSASRIAARWPWRSTIRSSENGASAASGFSISSSVAAAWPTSAMAAPIDGGRPARPRDGALRVGDCRWRQCRRGRHRSAAANVRGSAAATEGWSATTPARWPAAHRRCVANTSRHGLGERAATVVQQHQQRAFGGGAVAPGQIGDQPGPGQSPRGSAALALRELSVPTPIKCRTIIKVLPATQLEKRHLTGCHLHKINHDA